MKILSRLRASAKRFISKNSKSQAQLKRSPHSFTIEEIEPRILYSADNPLLLLASHVLAPSAIVRVEQDSTVAASQTTTAANVATQSRTLIVVDTRVENSQKLIADLQQRHQLGLVDVLVVDQNTNALQAIADFLEPRKTSDDAPNALPLQIDRLIVLSHGAQGSLELGDREITSSELTEQTAVLERWRTHLSLGADILLYGCDAGGGQAGIALTQTLASLTGADVAASIDATGNSTAGGNWILEQTVGSVQAIGDLSADWSGTLAVRSVTTNADSGIGSLRQAILDANSGSGDSIEFLLAPTQLTITPSTALPAISTVVTIDGNSFGSKVTISGASAGVADGLQFLNVSGSGSIVRNIVIRDFASGAGINIVGSSQVTVENSLIGTNRTGQIARANLEGIRIDNSAQAIVRNNVISGNLQSGIVLTGGGSVGADISNNTIGLNAGNSTAIANQGNGIAILSSAANNSITLNTIAFNAMDGITVANGAGSGNTVQQNSIFSNGLLAIDLSRGVLHDGTNPNDNLDADLGANGLQNSSEVLRVYSGSGTVTTDFSFSGAANIAVRFDYYWSDPIDGNAGRVWFGTSNGLTNASGQFGGSFNGVAAAPSGSVIRMLVTGPDGSSSELSNGLILGSPPLVSGLLGTPYAYVENSAAIPILDTLVITPTSSQLIYSTQVKFDTNFQTGADQLTFANTANLVGSWNAVTGVLDFVSLVPSTGVRFEEVQTALRSVGYSNTSDNPTNTTRTISVTLGDQSNSSVSMVSVGVTPVNDPVAVTLLGGVSTYTEQGVAVAIMNGTTLVDPDNAQMTGATIVIDALGLKAGDTLSFLSANGISGTFAGSTLTLTGPSSIANYQTALRNVMFSNLTNDDPAGSRTLSVRVNDGSGLGLASTRAFTVIGVNDAPVVTTNAGLTVLEGASFALGTANLNVTDPDSAASAIVFNVATAPTNGILAFAAAPTVSISSFTQANINNGLVVYVHSGSETISDSFSFSVSDGIAPSITRSVAITVTPVNDPVAVTLLGGVSTYTEQGVAVAIMNGTTLVDPDNAQMTGATIVIDALGRKAGDTLSFTNANGISGTFAGSTLTLTGPSSIANYQTALRNVMFSNLTNDDPAGSRTLSVRVNDGSGLGLASTRAFTVIGVNDAPVVVTSGLNNTYIEQATPTLIMSTTTLSDADSVNLAGAVISIAGGTSELGDVLWFSSANGISGTYDAPTFTLTLTGTSSVANYQAALRSIVFSNSISDNPTVSKILNVRVNDGTLNSTLVTRTINVTRVDDVPILISPPSAIFIEDAGAISPFATLTLSDPDTPIYQSATIRITSNYESGIDRFNFLNAFGVTGTWDINSGQLTLSSVSGVTIAQLQSALRSVTFDNSSNTPSTAIRTVVLTVSDGSVSTPVSSTLQVVPTNDAPVLTSPNPLYLFQGSRVAIGASQLSLIDTDSPNSALMFNIVTAPQYGRFELRTNAGVAINSFSKTQLIAGDIFYQHFNAPQATDTFTLNATDGSATTANITANIAVTLASNPVIVLNSGTVAFVENAPAVAIAPNLTITDLGGLTLNQAVITISGNYQPSEDQILFTNQNGIVGTIAGNTITLNNSATLAQYQAAIRSIQFRDTSDTPVTLNRTITITVFNAAISSNVLTQTLSVSATNDAPVVQNAVNFTIDEGANLTITSSFLRSIDPDNALSEIVYRISTPPINGKITFSSAPAVSITTFTQQDINNGLVRYTHEGLENTSDSFEFQVSDGTAPFSAPQLISITVNPVNDPASIIASGSISVYVEQAPGLAIFDTSTITDPDSSTLTGAVIRITSQAGLDLLSFTNQSGISGTWDPLGRQLILSGSASLVQYEAAIRSVLFSNTSNTPNPTKSFSIQLDDGTGVGLASALSISVTAVNDAPVTAGALSLSINEGESATITAGTLSAIDPDSPPDNSLVFSVLTNPLRGRIELAGSPGIAITSFTLAQIKNGQVIYVHDSSEFRTDTFTFTLSDGQATTAIATFNIGIANVDDAPSVTADPPLVFVEDGVAVQVFRNLAIVDPDTPTYNSAVVSIINNFIPNKDVLSWTPVGGLTVSWNASTGFLSISGTGTANDYVALLQSVNFSTSEQNPQTATREIYLSLVSSSPNTASFSQTLSITAVNDAPQFISAPTSLTTREDEAIVFTAANSITITDVDLNSGNIFVSLQVNSGTLTFAQTLGISFSVGDAGPNASVSFSGSITNVNAALSGLVYNANPNFFGSDSLQIILNDNGGTGSGGPKSASTAIPIAISAVNDPPLVAVNTGAFVAEGGFVNIDANILRVTDLEQTDSQLVFTVTSPLHGYLFLNGTPSVPIFSFTMQQVSAGLINYRHDASQTLTDSFSFVVSDGIQSSAPAVFALQVDGVNDAPVIGAPSVVQITEGINFVFTGSDRIQISDVDAGSAIERVSISLSFGKFSLSRTTGLTFSTGDGSSDQTMVFSGTLSAINSALDAMVVESDPSWTAGPTLSISVDDLGNSGTGGAKLANSVIRLNLNLVDDTPVLMAGVPITVAEGQATTLLTTSFVVTDPDTPLSLLHFSLAAQPSRGNLSVAGINNALSFTWSQLNSGQVRYLHDGSQTTSDQLQIFVSDASTSSNLVTVSIIVTPVNNAATLNLPTGAALTVTEQIVSSQVFTGLQIDDVDSTSLIGATIRLVEPARVGPSTGRFIFNDQNGIVGSWDASNGVLFLSGTASVANYEAALRSITFVDTSDNPAIGLRSAVLQVNDIGTSQSASVSRQINLVAVNDGPRLTAPVSLAVLEDSPLNLSTISVNDPDASNSPILLRLTATNGWMSFGSVAGLTFISGDGLQDQAIVLTGTQAAINTAISTLVFQGNADYFGVANIQIEVDDLGNTGTGGARTATQNISVDITAVNDLPILVASSGTLRYTEGSAPIAVDPFITVRDADNVTLFGARVRFTAGYVFGQDNLSFTDTPNLRGSWNAALGVLTFTGAGTAIELQNALRSVTYQNLSESSLSGSKTIAFDGVSDSLVGPSSNEVLRTLQYISVNDAPNLSGVVPTSFTEGSVPTSLFAAINLVDVDSTQISGFSVQLVAGFDQFNDQLQWRNTAGISVVWNAATGSLVATGSASVATYQSLLRSIAFTNSSDAPVVGVRLVRLLVTDFEGVSSSPVNTQVTVSSVNDAPTLARASVTPFSEGQVLRFGNLDNSALLLNDVDAGQGILVFEITGNAQVGQFDTSLVTASRLTFQPNQIGTTLRLTGTLDQLKAELHNLQYKPQSQFNGVTTFTASVTDNFGASVSTTLNIVYSAVDDSPVLTGSLGSLLLTAGNQPAVVLAPDIVINDPDSVALSSATLRVDSGFQAGDVLRLLAPAGFSSSWDSRTGVLTVTGPGTLDQYRTMLRTATFETTSQVTDERIVSIAVSDGSTSAAGVFERRLASANTPAKTPSPAPAAAPAGTPAPQPAPAPGSALASLLAPVPTTSAPAPAASAASVTAPPILENNIPISPTPAPVGNFAGVAPSLVQPAVTPSSAPIGPSTSTGNSGALANRLAGEINNIDAKNFNRDISNEGDASLRPVRGATAKGVERILQSNESSLANSNPINRLNAVSSSSSSASEFDGRALRNASVAERESNLREALKANSGNSNSSGSIQSLLQKRLQKGDDAGDARVVINVSRADELKVDLLALPVQGGGVVVSAVVLWWLTRAGGLLTALLAAIPTWQNFDPLPILGPTDRRDDDDEDEDEGEDKAIQEDLHEH